MSKFVYSFLGVGPKIVGGQGLKIIKIEYNFIITINLINLNKLFQD